MEHKAMISPDKDHHPFVCRTGWKEGQNGQMDGIKGGHLDFSHLTELKNIYITETYMKKQYKSSRIKNHKITKKFFF